MLRYKDINRGLKKLVGWQQSYDPTRHIDDELTDSESGLFFQSVHPMLTLYNIWSAMPDEWGIQYPEWNMLRRYKPGNKVRHNGYIWIAKASSINQEPTASDFNGDFSKDDYVNPFWRPYNQLSDYLRKLMYDGITTACQTFLQMKSLTQETKNILSHKLLFDGAGNYKDIILPTGNVVGYEITPVRSMGVTAKIEKIGLQMVGATGTIRVYLFHSSKIEPVAYKDVAIPSDKGYYTWVDVNDWFLPYMGSENYAGGSWYICYYEASMPKLMRSVNISKDWSREPCSNCNKGNVQLWREMNKYFHVTPFKVGVEPDFQDNPMLWDIGQMMYTSTLCYGMNLEFSVGCDLTDFIVEQKQLFATIVQKQVAVIALRTIAMNPNVRVNRNLANVSKMDILYELDGNTQGRETGLCYDLKKAYEAVSLDTRNIDRICLGCNNHGVRYKSI